MTEKRELNKAYPIWTMLIGLISFTLSGIFSGFLSLRVNEGLILILGIPIGSLLLLFFLRRLDKDKILIVIIRSEVGGFSGILAGFMIGSLFAWVISLIFPSFNDLSLIQAQILPNIFILIVADAIYGAILGDLLFGRKSIRFFALVCGLASIPIGILLSVPFTITWIRFDQNLLLSIISFGTTTGLSIGLYHLRYRID